MSKFMRQSTPYLFLLPAFIGLFIFNFYPMFDAFIRSLHTTSFGQVGQIFVGLKNYMTLFKEPVFWNSVKVTLILNIFINVIQISLAFGLALFLNKRFKGVGFFRAIHFIPVAVSVPIAAVLWGEMMHPEHGIINGILSTIGLPEQPFLTSRSQALGSIIVIASWKGVGYWMIFLLAGLQEIPKALYEASAIDGATKWQQFKNVVVPMMARPLAFVTVAVTVANFLLFAPMYILTGGGPRNSTNVLMLESFNSAFLYSDLGRASAIVVILLLIILSIILAQFKFLQPKH